jgi:hypothetical protein
MIKTGMDTDSPGAVRFVSDFDFEAYANITSSKPVTTLTRNSTLLDSLLCMTLALEAYVPSASSGLHLLTW